MGFCGITSSGKLHNFYTAVFIYHKFKLTSLFVPTQSVTDNVTMKVKMLTHGRTRGVGSHPLPHLARFLGHPLTEFKL